MFVIYHTYIDLDVIRIRIYKFLIYFILWILQVLTSGKPPTRAKVYINTHTKKGDGYPNDEARESGMVITSYLETYLCTS